MSEGCVNEVKTMDQAGAEGISQMLTASGYSGTAINYYLNKPHMGEIKDPDLKCQMTGSCGDTMGIDLKLENGIITDAKYQVMGCAGAVSAAMAVVDLIKGKDIAFAKTIDDGTVFGVLKEIPVKKHHCIQLAVKTLQKALDENTAG